MIGRATRKKGLKVSTRNAFGSIAIGRDEEAVYRALIHTPGADVADLAASTELPPRAIRAALTALEHQELVNWSAGTPARYRPTPPDIGLEALVRRQEDELKRVRTLAQQLGQDFRTARQGTEPAELVEILPLDDVLERFAQLQQSARQEVQILDTPPYRTEGEYPPNEAEIEALGRGVGYRVIYDHAALQTPRMLERAATFAAAGERARTTPMLPSKVAIVDHEVALAPLSRNPAGRLERCVIVHECSLLDALQGLFEVLWRQSTPMHPDGQAQHRTQAAPTPDDQQLLALMTAGMKDEAIAHQLGQSYRTTRRRISGLLLTLGVENRFQAGAAAAKRGWL